MWLVSLWRDSPNSTAEIFAMKTRAPLCPNKPRATPMSVGRLVDILLRTSGLSVWPQTTDRTRYAEERAVGIEREGQHELQAVFAGTVASD